MIFNVLRHLMNLEYVKDLNRLNAIINGKNVLSEYFERLKSTSQLSQTYIYILLGFSNLKKGYDKANAKFRNIPPNFAMKMLSPYDYNPWFVPTGSSFLKKLCCNNTENPKIHDPFLLSRITGKKGLDRNNAFSSRFIKEASKKRFVLAVDLKVIRNELKEHDLSLDELSTSKQTSEKHSAHSTNDSTLDDDPQDFYVKFANFDTRPQNVTLLSQCKKLIESVFYPILSANAKPMYKNQSPTLEQNLTISSYKKAFSSFNFTELLYSPIEQAQRGDKTRGCEFLYKNNNHARFGSAINSMIDD
ncbi:hypothetical protein AX774_g552 [Zancudomyces culisetae]|uniref:Uncharacterized protein n=1 Tax=Zancudomyces culisetae TaxID=1213189 RepID=A0A1R1PY73_ZANCU|nr:hypothetical protein AX774_g552 [Zancudomyces culisetae]|eukprot:OMH85889.1 hypothetical protein AX774_g552 [Zancudomyces culisetae]